MTALVFWSWSLQEMANVRCMKINSINRRIENSHNQSLRTGWHRHRHLQTNWVRIGYAIQFGHVTMDFDFRLWGIDCCRTQIRYTRKDRTILIDVWHCNGNGIRKSFTFASQAGGFVKKKTIYSLLRCHCVRVSYRPVSRQSDWDRYSHRTLTDQPCSYRTLGSINLDLKRFGLMLMRSWHLKFQLTLKRKSSFFSFTPS